MSAFLLHNVNTTSCSSLVRLSPTPLLPTKTPGLNELATFGECHVNLVFLLYAVGSVQDLCRTFLGSC